MNLTPEQLGILNDEVRQGVGAETLLRVLSPILKDRVNVALNSLEHAPPSLNELLDLRARITVLRQIERELNSAIDAGRNAARQL